MISLFKKKATTQSVGRRGERAAARYLARRGFRILGRNLETIAGEADLLCEESRGGLIVLVEVKARQRETSQRGKGEPEQQITPAKKKRLLGIAVALKRANAWHDRAMRIDVIAVDFTPGSKRPIIRHHVNAVSANP